MAKQSVSFLNNIKQRLSSSSTLKTTSSLSSERIVRRKCTTTDIKRFAVVYLLVTLLLLPFCSIVSAHRMGNEQAKTFGGSAVMGDESLMCQKEHGTTKKPVMYPLRWSVDAETADKICCFNRHYAEFAGYFSSVLEYWKDLRENEKIEYYDSVTGKRLFTAPIGRTMEEFIAESKAHGWPSFRDQEVDWENVRVLSDGETVSVDGTHLGHNLPDEKGNRYCINLVSIAGLPPSTTSNNDNKQ